MAVSGLTIFPIFASSILGASVFAKGAFLPNHAPSFAGCQWTISDAIKQKTRVTTWFYTGFLTFLDAVKQVPGGDGGIRTLDTGFARMLP